MNIFKEIFNLTDEQVFDLLESPPKDRKKSPGVNQKAANQIGDILKKYGSKK